MPCIFLGTIGIGIHLSYTMPILQPYIAMATVLVWFQYSICIIFFRDHYTKTISALHTSWEALPMSERKEKQEKVLYALSCNPFFPLIHRYFRISVPLIEGLFILFIIVYSFFWNHTSSTEIQALPQNLYIL